MRQTSILRNRVQNVSLSGDPPGGAPSHAKHEMTSLNCRGLSGGLGWIGLLWRRRRAWHSCLSVGWLVGSATLAFSCIHRSAGTDCAVAAHEEVSCARWRRKQGHMGCLGRECR